MLNIKLFDSILLSKSDNVRTTKSVKLLNNQINKSTNNQQAVKMLMHVLAYG